MPEPDDATLDALLSATFAVLPAPVPSRGLQARMRETAKLEAVSPLPVRVEIVEQRQANVWTRTTYRTTPGQAYSTTVTPTITEKHTTRLRTTLLVNRKGTP